VQLASTPLPSKLQIPLPQIPATSQGFDTADHFTSHWIVLSVPFVQPQVPISPNLDPPQDRIVRSRVILVNVHCPGRGFTVHDAETAGIVQHSDNVAGSIRDLWAGPVGVVRLRIECDKCQREAKRCVLLQHFESVETKFRSVRCELERSRKGLAREKSVTWK